MSAAQDRSQWVAVLEALDEVEARIPTDDPRSWLAESRLADLRETARSAIAALSGADRGDPETAA